MEKVGSITQRESDTLDEINATLESVRQSIAKAPVSLNEAVATLMAVRVQAYENINQLQHVALILRAIKYLSARIALDAPVEWYWHPRQTSGVGEGDIQARLADGSIFLSAEATTSIKAIGTIRERMKSTLRRLQAMEGEKYYFVASKGLEKAARNFIGNTHGTAEPLNIIVVNLMSA